MKYAILAFLIQVFTLFYTSLVFSENGNNTTTEQQGLIKKINSIWASLDRQQGKIVLPGDIATLEIPKSFFYINPNDTEKILVDIWGNLPGAGLNSLGMLFPNTNSGINENTWGVTIEYEQDGYVLDENADEINYNELLSEMKEGTNAASNERVKQGYESIELIGWAAKPFYDKKSHKLHWAKEIKFGAQSVNTLNYNIRILGRKGVLVLNFIASMEQKEIITENLDTVLALAEFNQGSRYDDFIPDVDEVAAYGIGALIVGKVIAKTGFFVVLLLFLKKFGIIIVMAVLALVAKFFKRKKFEKE